MAAESEVGPADERALDVGLDLGEASNGLEVTLRVARARARVPICGR